MNCVPRRLLAMGVAVAVLTSAGCAGRPGEVRDVAAAPRSGTPSPTPSPRLDPPPEDGRVAGPLWRAAVAPPPGFRVPLGGSGAHRTGSFTVRSYVRDFYGGSKEVLEDLRLSRLRRGFQGYAQTRDGRQWLHLVLFEARDSYGATMIKSMLFGSRNAGPYQVRLLDDALGEVVHRKDTAGGRYVEVNIAFVTGNVYVVVNVAGRGPRPATRLAERLALAQKRRLRAVMLPTA